MKHFQYKHVIWDWNGTLLNDAWLCHEITNTLLEQHRLPLVSFEKYTKIFRHPVSAIYTDLGFQSEDPNFETLSREFHAHYEARRHECVPHDGAVEILSLLRSQEIPCSIVSAHPQEMLDFIVNSLELRSWFETVLGLSHHRADSKISVAKDFLAQLGLSGAEVLVIGDTHHDHEVARELGADCVLLASGFQNEDILKEHQVPTFPTLGEFHKFVRSNFL